MALMLGKLYDALTSAGVDAGRAREAAEEVALYESEFAAVRGEIAGLRTEFGGLRTEFAGLRGEVNLLKWMVGFNIALTILVFGKLFLG